MLIQIDQDSGVPIYSQLVRQLRTQIATGLLAPGAALPSVRDLAGSLKINPMTVSKAYSQLESLHFIEHRRGVGMFVSAVNKDIVARLKNSMLEESLSKSAFLALQLNIGLNEAKRIFENQYRQFMSKKEDAHEHK
jgi:GntR family transcriptional regulator